MRLSSSSSTAASINIRSLNTLHRFSLSRNTFNGVNCSIFVSFTGSSTGTVWNRLNFKEMQMNRDSHEGNFNQIYIVNRVICCSISRGRVFVHRNEICTIAKEVLPMNGDKVWSHAEAENMHSDEIGADYSGLGWTMTLVDYCGVNAKTNSFQLDFRTEFKGLSTKLIGKSSSDQLLKKYSPFFKEHQHF